MDNKKIESRYTIEYIYPDSSSKAPEKTSSNIGVKLFLSISILGLLALGLTSSLYYPFSSIDRTPKVVIEVKDSVTPVNPSIELVSETLTTNNEEDIEVVASTSDTEEVQVIEEETITSPPKQDLENNQLIEQLNNISKQLTFEKEKNKQLSSLIDINEGKNDELSQMLKEALNKASTADKRYLDALSLLGNKSISKEEITTSNNSTVTDEVAQQTPTVSTTPTSKNIVTIPSTTQSQVNDIIALLEKETVDQANRTLEKTSLSIEKARPIENENITKLSKAPVSQVDAIIAAMSGVNLSPKRKIKSPPEKPTIILQASETITKKQQETELLHIRLQKQINDLIVTNELQTSDYNSALTTESATRNNAVRSITVRKGDTLWDIARRAYGNGSYYKKIIEANPEVTKKGKIYLKEGQIIRVPI